VGSPPGFPVTGRIFGNSKMKEEILDILTKPA
jgi:hypothetical protein